MWTLHSPSPSLVRGRTPAGHTTDRSQRKPLAAKHWPGLAARHGMSIKASPSRAAPPRGVKHSLGAIQAPHTPVLSQAGPYWLLTGRTQAAGLHCSVPRSAGSGQEGLTLPMDLSGPGGLWGVSCCPESHPQASGPGSSRPPAPSSCWVKGSPLGSELGLQPGSLHLSPGEGAHAQACLHLDEDPPG